MHAPGERETLRAARRALPIHAFTPQAKNERLGNALVIFDQQDRRCVIHPQ